MQGPEGRSAEQEDCAANDSAISANIADWIALDAHIACLTRRWQQLETQMFADAGEQAATGNHAGLRESEEMCALDSEIDESHQRLASLAAEICLLPAKRRADAMSKISVGLRVQGRSDWQPNALELIETGLSELGRLPA